MNAFNSLGSDFTMPTAFAAAFARAEADSAEKLLSYLEKRYGGKPYLFYKGREALSAALTASGLPPQSGICITGYTCFAVYQAVTAANMIPVFVDIGDDDVNFTAEDLELLVKKRPEVGAVVVQNTYGFPQDMMRIAKVARKYGLTIIEDLAHSVGTVYASGEQAGRVGDFTALSFSQDKIIDAVSGGALVIRKETDGKTGFPKRIPVPSSQTVKDRWYPFMTALIRTSYPFPGKALHAGAKAMHLLSQPMGDVRGVTLHDLPSWHARLAMQAFRFHREDLSHRKKIAALYVQTVKKQCLLPALTPLLPRASCLRFPVIVKDRAGLLAHAKRRGLHISDIWYDAPVAPKKYFLRTSYAGECPNGEALSDSVINLPTHRNISPETALEIADIVNAWHT